jgi:hypothetical protein
MSGRARIRLERRRTPWTDRLRKYYVSVDEERVGSIGFGEEKLFDVAPGHRRVQLHIDWARSQPVEVSVTEGEEVRLVCRGRNPLLALYWITAGRNRYVMVESPAEKRSRSSAV